MSCTFVTAFATAAISLIAFADADELAAQADSSRLLGSELAAHVLIYTDVKESLLDPDDCEARVKADAWIPLAEAVGDARRSDVAVYLHGLPYLLVVVDKERKRFEAWKVFPNTRPKNVIFQVAIRSTEKGFEIGGIIPEHFLGYAIDKELDILKFIERILENQDTTSASEDANEKPAD